MGNGRMPNDQEKEQAEVQLRSSNTSRAVSQCNADKSDLRGECSSAGPKEPLAAERIHLMATAVEHQGSSIESGRP